MSAPDRNLFLFEYWLNLAIAAHLSALGIIDAKKQRDKDGLITPRVEIKTVWSGWTDHRYVVPSTGAVWFDMGRGKVILKCVTRRNDDSSAHDALVGTVRWAMQLFVATSGYTPGNPNPETISDRMPYHRISRLIDTGATPSFTPNELQDVTALGFDFDLHIRQEKFPQS